MSQCLAPADQPGTNLVVPGRTRAGPRSPSGLAKRGRQIKSPSGNSTLGAVRSCYCSRSDSERTAGRKYCSGTARDQNIETPHRPACVLSSDGHPPGGTMGIWVGSDRSTGHGNNRAGLVVVPTPFFSALAKMDATIGSNSIELQPKSLCNFIHLIGRGNIRYLPVQGTREVTRGAASLRGRTHACLRHAEGGMAFSRSPIGAK